MSNQPSNNEQRPHLPTDKELQELSESMTLDISKTLHQEIQKSVSKARTEQDYEYLQQIVTEYLKCFIIIGYSLDGKAVVIGQANNPQDHNSLVEHLRQTFIRVMQKSNE